MKILFGLAALSLVALSANAQESALSGNGDIRIGAEKIGIKKNKYGGESFEANFVITKYNSSPILAGYVPKYSDKPPANLRCGSNGAEFYIRHDALSFATPPSSGRYYIVRTGQTPLTSTQCKRLAAVWVEGKSLKIPLLFLGDHWKYDKAKNKLVTWGGSNNIYSSIGDSLKN